MTQGNYAARRTFRPCEYIFISESEEEGKSFMFAPLAVVFYHARMPFCLQRAPRVTQRRRESRERKEVNAKDAKDKIHRLPRLAQIFSVFSVVFSQSVQICVNRWITTPRSPRTQRTPRLTRRRRGNRGAEGAKKNFCVLCKFLCPLWFFCSTHDATTQRRNDPTT